MQFSTLAELIQKSAAWSSARRGRELMAYAAADCRALFKVDHGVFLYAKTFPVQEPVAIFQPWGIFQSLTDVAHPYLRDNPQIRRVTDVEWDGRWLTLDEMPTVTRQFAEAYGIQSIGGWPITLREECMGYLILARTHTVTPDDSDIVSAASRQISIVLELIRAYRIVEDASLRDWLTGIWNRRGVFSQVEKLSSMALLQGSTVVVGLLDVDEFKVINDRRGHVEGDRILKDVGNTLKDALRTSDIVGRWGGDEFLFVFQADEQHISIVERKVLSLFAEKTDDYTVSVGFAIWGRDGNDLESCYHMADQRMYHKKAFIDD